MAVPFYGPQKLNAFMPKLMMYSSWLLICHIHTHTSILLFIPKHYKCINISDCISFIGERAEVFMETWWWRCLWNRQPSEKKRREASNKLCQHHSWCLIDGKNRHQIKRQTSLTFANISFGWDRCSFHTDHWNKQDKFVYANWVCVLPLLEIKI